MRLAGNRLPRWISLPAAAMSLALLVVSGCAQWDATAEGDEAWKLPPPKMAPDAVVLEIALLRISPALVSEADQLWSEADEQHLPIDVRRRLHENGLRAGVLSVQMPVSLQRLLEGQSSHSNLAAADPEQLEKDIAGRQYRVQSRNGNRHAVATGKTEHSVTVLISESGSVRGETFDNAQCMFGIRTSAQTDGRVQLELVPEIDYGQPRNRRVAAEGIWRLDYGRERKSYDALRTQATLAPGQTVVVAATADAVGLGGSFFRRDPESTILLIRVAQTQSDDLFREDEQLAPISTSAH